MLDNREPPGIEERYGIAVGASDTRVETHADRKSPSGDAVLAAGFVQAKAMSPQRLGLALTRLASEWDRAGKPIPLTVPALEALARTYPRIKTPDGKKDTKLVWMTVVNKETKKKEEVRAKPIVKARQEAAGWYSQELELLLQRLKTLPEVKAALHEWAYLEGITDYERVIPAVLLWWLNKSCPVCRGVMFKVIPGTGRISNKACNACRGEGESNIPHGGPGRRVVGHINHCRREAIKGMQARFQHQHKAKP